MQGYDAWLEAPYVAAAAENDAYEKFCEAKGLIPDDQGTWEAFEQARADEMEMPDLPDDIPDYAPEGTEREDVDEDDLI